MAIPIPNRILNSLQEYSLNDAEMKGMTREEIAVAIGESVKKVMNNMWPAYQLAFDNGKMILKLRPVHKILAFALYYPLKLSLRHWFYKEKSYMERRINGKQNSYQRVIEFGRNNNLLNGEIS